MSDDVWSPAQIAERVRAAGESKVRLPLLPLLLLALLAGAFIALGAVLSLVVTTGSQLGFGPTRLLGGVAFSVGLVLVVVAGAELFTGNNLVAIAWASRRIRTRELLRSWALVYLGNVAGALATAALVGAADVQGLAGGALGETALAVARAKVELGALEVFARGVLCNALVCLAVWMAMGGRSLSDKAVAIVFPVAAFVATGFEHSIANWFFLPYAAWSCGLAGEAAAGIARNLAASTAGNVVGGSLLVAAVYWLAYLSPWSRRDPA